MDKKNRSFQNGLLIGVSATVVVMSLVILAGTFFLIPRLSGSGSTESRKETSSSQADVSELEEKIQEIDTYINDYYIFDVDKEKMTDALLAGYLQGLGDPYSVYYTE